MKNKVKIFSVVFAMIFILSGCKIQSPDEYKNEETGEIKNPITVTLEIECKKLEGNLDKGKPEVQKLVPADYIILEKTEFTVEEGSSPLELLELAAKENDIVINKSGGYVKGINGLSEFSFGSTSGWFYFVNDYKCTVGASAYSLKDGDEVRFTYTLTLE